MTKKFAAALLAVFCMLGILSGCVQKPANDNNKLKIVCTVAPVYDWALKIVGERADSFEISCLSGSGDLHSFQPTVRDMSKILKSDLFVTSGGLSEEWTDKLKLSEGTKHIELLDLVPESSLICQEQEEHHEHNHNHDHEHSADEHIWLSLKLAQLAVDGICEAICDIDTANGVIYQKNAAEYIDKLKKLDLRYEDEINKHFNKTMIFADRFPFAYMMQDYGISYYAAFPGCSTDSDASFETVARLCRAIEESGRKTVVEIENSNQNITKAIKTAMKNTEITSVVMDSCQAVSEARIEEFDYLEVMEKNLRAISKALE